MSGGAPPEPGEETVAAVVITFQRRDMLRRTLEGLRAQERPVDELVVIDNATTDGTAAMLERDFPDVTHLRMEDNIGPAGALQVGFAHAHARGHRWAWTHSDDILARPDALKTLLATAGQLGDTHLGLLCCWFEPVSTHYFHNGALWRHRVVQQQWPPVGSPPYPTDVMTFKGALISLAMVPEIGLPVGDYFLMMEEYEYCLRAKRAGFRHYALPVPLLVPLEDEPPGRYPPWRGYYQVRNHLAMVLGRRSPGELLWFAIVQGKYLVGAVKGGERVGERVRLRLLGAWHALRGVTGKTIDPAWWSPGGPRNPGPALKRVLVTGAGGSPATNFVRSLRAAPDPVHLAGTDADPYTLLRAETDTRHLVPPASDPAYLDVLNALIELEDIGLVHAQNDAEVAFLSEHRDQVRARLYLPARETVRACLDKFSSFEAWRAAGLPVPDTMLLRSEDDLEAAFERFGGSLWLRATTGAGGKGALPVRDHDTARAWLELHKGWGSFTAAELLEPDSITWMSIWHDGELVVAQGRKRLYWELARISPSGVTGVTGAGVTIADPALDELATAAVLAIDRHPHGLFGVDLTYDRAGVPNPTEINVGRFFTTHQFFTALGVNLPYAYLKLAFGEPPPPFPRRLNPAPEGMVWIRGVDFRPVLAPGAEIDRHVAALEELRRTLDR